MAKRRKKRSTIRGLPTPVWVVGVVGIVLLMGGLIILSSGQEPNPGNVPYPDVPRISPTEAHSQQQSDTGIIIDVRNEQSYQASHAAGAWSLPEDGLSSWIHDLPTDKTLILYCT